MLQHGRAIRFHALMHRKDLVPRCIPLQDAQTALAKKVEELSAIEADVENMRKMLGRGKKGKGGKVPASKSGKGFGSTGPAGATSTTPSIEAENSLRQELKQAQVRVCTAFEICREGNGDVATKSCKGFGSTAPAGASLTTPSVGLENSLRHLLKQAQV